MPTENIPNYLSPGRPKPPVALVVVASIFIAFGILSILNMIVALTRNTIVLDFNFLAIFIGRGLLRYKSGWRTCALVILWVQLIALPLFLLLLCFLPIAPDFKVVGVKVAAPQSVIVGIGITMCVVFFLLALWQYRVLIRRDVRALFGLPSLPAL